ncbi:MAG: phage portal protein [Alphaproteobacteria bacterium]
MGLLRRLADRLDPPLETRDQTVSPDESWFVPATLAGQRPVNARLAENLSTVLACVNAIASAIAALPVWVYQRTDKGRDVNEAHPVMRLVREGPNQHQSWPDYIEFLVASTLLRGNGLSEIVTDSVGQVRELVPIAWEWASVQLLPTGRLAYDVSSMTTLYGGTGRPKRILQDGALHVRDRSDDGLIGRSRLQRAAAVLSAGLNVQEFSNAMFLNGANPSGVLEVDGKLGDDKLKTLAGFFRDAFSGPHNAAKALVLDQGIHWKAVSVSPEDAELLASRRFSTEELARLFGCPPPIIGDLSHGTFTNSETAGRWFAQHTLTPWIRKLETAFTRSVFSEADRATHTIEFDMSAMLRGDPEQRWRSHQIAVDSRILLPNEVREIEGFNPRDGGDTFPERSPAPSPPSPS